MADRPTPTVPTPSADQRRVAVENHLRAEQVRQTGNHDYAITLLKLCCAIDPANLGYRRALRQTQKEKYDNNLRGSRLAFLSTPRFKAKIKKAKVQRDYLKVLEFGEEVLTRNPWDMGTQMDMAEAFDALGLVNLAVFTLDQARQKYPKDPTLNRALARLFEKRGDFKSAIVLWQLVKEAAPTDVEASHKAKDLAASETIARGGYEGVADGSKASPALGKMEDAAGKPDKLARDTAALLKRIEADPTEPALYAQLAAAYRRHGHDDRARAALQQGLGPTGNHFSLQLELQELEIAPLRTKLEQTDAELKKLKELAAAGDEPADGPSVEDLAAAKAKLAKEVAAREVDVLRMKADRFPADLSHRLDLGQRLLKADRVNDAVTELQQAKKDDKLKGRASLFLGLCFRKLNNLRLAQRNLEDALQALPANDEAGRKEVLYQLATAAAEGNDLPRAVDLGHELANLDFNFKNIGPLLQEWEKRVPQA